MKKIVLYGAFDRYNYGDNIMPILFEMFVSKYAKHLLDDFSFEYAAISNSDLEKYDCKPTKNINNFTHTMPAGSALVVIGGEVLCTQNQTLYLHTQNNLVFHFLLKVFKKLLPSIFKRFAEMFYSADWEYPFIPPKAYFSEHTRIIYNTVGGDIKNLSESQLDDITTRFNNAAYVSVRDKRTFDEISSIYSQTQLAPDSAYIMSDLVDKNSLTAKVSSAFLAQLPNDYFVFQASPNKVGCSVSDCIEHITTLADNTGNKVLLLPIGYASGHDDYHLLRKINKALPDKTVLVYELTLWEIMYAIMASKGYFGTSLHGAITAMSFNIPHFGINNKITKLDAFLQDWSVAPFNKCYPIEEISSLAILITEESIAALKSKSASNIEKVKNNYQAIIRVIETT